MRLPLTTAAYGFNESQPVAATDTAAASATKTKERFLKDFKATPMLPAKGESALQLEPGLRGLNGKGVLGDEVAEEVDEQVHRIGAGLDRQHQLLGVLF